MNDCLTLIRWLARIDGTLEFRTDKDGALTVRVTGKQTDKRLSVKRVVSKLERESAKSDPVINLLIPQLMHDLTHAFNDHCANNKTVKGRNL